jgi:pimeloyl-ACP methyl ester carboxylesterase
VDQITRLVYTGIRGITRAVGLAVDQTLEQLAPLLGESVPGPERLAVVAALNGVIGDLLERTGSPLAQPFDLCRRGVALELTRPALHEAMERASRRLLVLVHGSSMNDLQWSRLGHDHGVALERELGFSALYARYNSGLHISTNGALLAARLEELVRAWPVKVESVVLLGHSMGGLVARSACHAAELARLSWRSRLDVLVCLGTPHQGAPLERGGNWLETLLGISEYTAPIAKLARIRSAGVTDLRFGYVRDEDWTGTDRFAPGPDRRARLPLPNEVRCSAIAATLSPAPARRLRGDGLVSVASALGRSEDPRLELHFPEAHQHVVYGAGHLDLLNRADVYELLSVATRASGS